MKQEFSHVYNCHYQFGESLMAISMDSQMNGFRGSICIHPQFFKGAQPCALSFLVGCHFRLAALKGIKPSLHSRCRYLSKVGRSISHQSGRPLTVHPDTRAAFPFHSPLHLVGLACHDPVQ